MYREGFNTQPVSLSLTSWKRVLDDKYFGEGVLMDLPKAFDILNYEFLIAKLSGHGFTN